MRLRKQAIVITCRVPPAACTGLPDQSQQRLVVRAFEAQQVLQRAAHHVRLRLALPSGELLELPIVFFGKKYLDARHRVCSHRPILHTRSTGATRLASGPVSRTEQLPFIVRRATAIEVVATDDRFKGRRRPLTERVNRLDVAVQWHAWSRSKTAGHNGMIQPMARASAARKRQETIKSTQPNART